MGGGGGGGEELQRYVLKDNDISKKHCWVGSCIIT